MRNCRFALGIALTILCFEASSPSAHGVLLTTPGVPVPLPGTSLAADPKLDGVILEDELVPFEIPGQGGGPVGPIAVGMIRHMVVRSSVDSTLDFYWRVTNSAGTPILSLSVEEFFVQQFDADWRNDIAGDKAPKFGLLRSVRGATFRFADLSESGDGVSGGETSRWMFLDTTARAYERRSNVTISSVTTGIAGSNTFGPTVPEPAAGLLAVAAAVGEVMRRRRAARCDDNVRADESTLRA